MKRVIDQDALLAPIPGDNPSGKDLRYKTVYDEIKEARRAEDPLAQGEWKHEVKTSDWDRVITLALNALTRETKDCQIAAWLNEALIMTEGFDGLIAGMKILIGFLTDYWDSVYPLIEEGDLEFRAAPLEFMNEKLPACIMQIPLTDRSITTGYSLLKWKESREVGHESDARNKYGDVDEDKRKKRDELMSEGKLPAEEFDKAVALSSTLFYKSLSESIMRCQEDFQKLDEIADQNFGSDAPRLAEFRGAIEECSRVIMKIYKEKKEQEPVPESTQATVDGGTGGRGDGGTENSMAAVTGTDTGENQDAGEILNTVGRMPSAEISSPPPLFSSSSPSPLSPSPLPVENALWEEAMRLMKTSGFKQALNRLLTASLCAPSVRGKNRYRLLMAKICLKADRPDLARPIIEELHGLIEELHLERWESPLWIAEVLDTLYQCLTKGDPPDDDLDKARGLLRRLCAMDVTQAISYKK